MNTKKASRATIVAVLAMCPALHADAVTDWNNIALDTIRLERTSPPIASRALAIIHIAIYEAVNGVKQPHEQKFESYLVKGHAKGQASEEAAASAAARSVLVNLFPAQKSSFDAAYAAALDAIPDGKSKERGITWGEYVANTILGARANDGAAAILTPPSGSGPGHWVPTPPGFAPYQLPYWGFVTPFAMADRMQFRPPGPPILSSVKWAMDYNEVKSLGAATGSTRTPDQTEIALFWADGAGTETPPGHWNSIAQEVAAIQGNTPDDNARLFALLNIALADAAICAWDAKHTFDFWRPVTAIRNGDTDDNPATDPDRTWSSFIVTPPFPDYVSGHSAFSGAAATVLAHFYGTDDIAFTAVSDFLPGVRRSFASLSAAAEEAALSRLYGGIHYRSANEDGIQAGIGIGNYVSQHFLQPMKKNRK